MNRKNSLDKNEIALALREGAFGSELRCTLIEEGVINECRGCGLKGVCEKIDRVVCEYEEENTKVIGSFTF